MERIPTSKIVRTIVTTQVVRIGAARNLASVIQEMGRVGRNEKDGSFLFLYNEFHDDQRLCAWVKSANGNLDLENAETKVILNDFCDVWKLFPRSYFSNGGVGQPST